MRLSSKYKRYSLFALAATFLIALIAAVSLLVSEYAVFAERNIQLSGTNFFYTSNDAEVDEYCLDDTEQIYYQGFIFNSGSDYVTYRKNLAYYWWAEDKDEDSSTYGEVLEGRFSMTIGFDSLSFETFTIKFQSQQYVMTEDEVTTNYLTFVADTSNDCVYVIASTEDPLEYDGDDAEDPIKTASARIALTGYDKITIEFSSKSVNGVYPLKITDSDKNSTEDDTAYTYQLENVGSTYAKYVSSSSSNSVIPMTFSAAFAEDATETVAEMILYKLNGQSFLLSGDAGDMRVTDNVAPVLCLDDDFTTVKYGSSLDITYAAIDVLATSPSTTVNYYILTETQAAANVDLDEASETIVYTSAGSSDTYAFIDNLDYYGSSSTLESGDGYTTKCLVKIYLTIKDSSATGGTSDDVYLEWYVEDTSYLQTVNEGTNYESNFIKVVQDNQGVSYTYTPIYEDEDTNRTYTYDEATFPYASIEELQAEYQAAVEDAIDEQDASAGDGNYLYLPSFEGYVSDNLVGYRDMTFSIYYIAGSNSSVSSNTSLDYNELAISISTEGTYRFVIFATDSESNEMYYWCYGDYTEKVNGVEESKTGWHKVTFTSSDISDMLTDTESELWGYVPYFEFSVKYEGLVVETPEAQDIAYVDSTYSVDDFDITGLDSGYSTEYTLFEFNRELWTKNHKEVDTNGTVISSGSISYSEMIDIVASVFEETGEYENSGSNATYFKYIKALDEMEETDDDYEDFCDYEWDADSLSFVPQTENTFYVIRLVVTDTSGRLTKTVTSYMVISASAAAEELDGESRWLKDNLASVILLAVAGAALIGIVLLIVIKPKEKGDIDIIDLNEENKKSRKKIAKGKKSKK